jgi:hemerythrin superfamily protein
MPTETIFEILKAEHKEVAGVMKQIAATEDDTAGRAERRRLFDGLYAGLGSHAKGEEVAFYPVLTKIEEARDIGLEAGEEHKVVEALLEELKTMRPMDDRWMAKFTVLKENVEHHVGEEEGELFRKAKKSLSEEQIEKITAAYKRARDKALAGAEK